MQQQFVLRAVSLAAAGLVALGCGGASPPHEAQADAQAAMRSADVVGAEEVPEAAYFLELARESVSLAERLAERGDMTQAERALERAGADAELAIALARRADARREATELRESIDRMREGLL